MEKTIFTTDQVELLDDENTAEASFSQNPLATMIRFIFTDDIPNGNKQRTPMEEFDNIIRTGALMPIKQAQGTQDGHEGASPIGVITNLKKVKNQIIGLAAIWDKEKPNDKSPIKEKFLKREPINLSWELLYGDSELDEDTGVQTLKDIIVKATTIVGLPAYAGRTPIVAVAEKNKEDNVEELQTLQTEIESKNEMITQLQTELATLREASEAQATELTELKEFKASYDAEVVRATRLGEIKTLFSEAGLQRDEQYFDAHQEQLLALDEDALKFFVQELVSFAEVKDAKSEVTPKVPLFGSPDTAPGIQDMVQFLRKNSLTK